MGLASLYRFLVQREPADVPDPLSEEDPAAAIGARALADPASLARKAAEMFMAAYGAFAGDMALTLMARGGVFLAGGVTQKLLPLLEEGVFMSAFNAKAEHAGLVRKMPVYVVTDPEIGLHGAAILANMALRQERKSIDRSQ
jgi:glucokinase